MGVERLAAIESARLLLREPSKYAGLVAGFYLLSLKDCELGKVTRAYYLFFRHIDDFLDEPKNRTDEQITYVLNLRNQIVSGNFNGNPKIGELAKYSLEAFERKARSTDNPRQDFVNVIDAIVFDHKRAGERRVLSQKELDDYYHATFFPVVNLALIGIDSQFRAKDIPALSYGQGRVFSVRDLKEDWQRGVINIPKEVLGQTQLTQHSSIEELKTNPTVTNWLRSELSESELALLAVKAKLKASGEKITPLLCNGVIKTASRLMRNYNSKDLNSS